MSSARPGSESADLRTPWQRVAGGVWVGSAFVASAIVHVVILLILARVVFQQVAKSQKKSTLTASVSKDVPVEMQPDDLAVRPEDVADEPSFKSPILLPAAVEPAAQPRSSALSIDTDVGAPPALDADVGSLDVLTRAVSDAVPAPDVGTHVIDRISASGSYRTIAWKMSDQISGTARGHRGVLLIWLTDASISMSDDAQAIARRVWDVYSTVKATVPLVSMSIVRFGEEPQKWLEPTGDIDRVMRALIAVPTSPSGRENVMAALTFCTTQFPADPAVKRIICVLTDERGDDLDQLEPTLRNLKQSRITVYVIGRESFFQSDTGSEGYYDDDRRQAMTGRTQRGPETARYERFWLGDWRRNIPSGFGPYALSRIAIYTGGSYFLLNEGQAPGPRAPSKRPLTASGYDPEVLQYYRPDLSSVAAYGHRLRSNKTYQLLMRLYGQRDRLQPMYRTFFTRADFSKVARRIDHNLAVWSDLVRQFDDGMVPDLVLQRMKDRRWVAHYDCARANACLALYNTYQSKLSLMRARGKKYSFKKLKIASGRMPPIKAGKERAYRERVVRAFSDVVRRHHDTPWARLARPLTNSKHSRFRSWALGRYIPPKPHPPDYTPPPRPPGPKPI